MDPLMIGVILVIIIFGVAGFFLYSAASGVTTLKTASLVGGGAGVVGSITTVFSDAWQFIVSSMYGQLGMYGWLLIGGIGFCLVVWAWNGFQDLSRNRPLFFVE